MLVDRALCHILRLVWLTVDRARSSLRNGWQKTSATSHAIVEAVDGLLSPHEVQPSPGPATSPP